MIAIDDLPPNDFERRTGRLVTIAISVLLMGLFQGVAKAGRTADSDIIERSISAMNDLPSLYGTCVFGPLNGALSLSEAIERAICMNPRTKKAWASLVGQLEQLGIDEAAYFPIVSGNASVGREHSTTIVEQARTSNSDISSQGRTASVNVNLDLFDFGKRRSKVERARQLVAAANASQDVVLIEVFLDAAQAYYDVIDAEASLRSAQRAEEVAKESLSVASGRYNGGTAALTDQLQAQTAYLQSKIKRVLAEGTLATNRGQLAVAMGADADGRFTLKTTLSDAGDISNLPSPEKLIAAAKRNNPKIAAARAQWLAAEAAVSAAIAQGRPSISLVANYGRTDRNLNRTDNIFNTSDIPADSINRDRYAQLKLTVPIFDGFAKDHSIRQARSEAVATESDLQSAEEQLTLDVWKAYQQLVSLTDGVKVNEELLRVAEQSLNASETRYRLGSGNIVDVLNAQTALASAEQQRIAAISSWRTAKLRLVASLGNVGLWVLE